MFRTVSVTLINKVQRMVDGQPVYDDTDRPIYDTSEKTVSGVLVGMPESEEVLTEVNMSGRTIAYTLAIPKGDSNNWVNAEVILPQEFGGGSYRTIGSPLMGIESNVPTPWHKKVRLERYE